MAIVILRGVMNGISLRAKVRDERGDVASSVMIFSVALLFFLATVHVMFVFHGNNILKAASQDALAAAQIAAADQTGADPVAIATAIGEERLALFPGLEDGEITIGISGDQIVVTATGKVNTPIFGDIGTDLESVASGPIEQFYSQFERD